MEILLAPCAPQPDHPFHAGASRAHITQDKRRRRRRRESSVSLAYGGRFQRHVPIKRRRAYLLAGLGGILDGLREVKIHDIVVVVRYVRLAVSLAKLRIAALPETKGVANIDRSSSTQKDPKIMPTTSCTHVNQADW